MKELQRFIEAVISDSRQVVAMGLILYTDEHPHIKRVLRNDDYWKALSEASGRKWTVLAARAKRGKHEYSTPPPGSLAMMRMIWNEPNENKSLLQSFHLESTESLPVFVLFTPLQSGEVLQSKVRLEDSTEQEAYDRLKRIILAATSAVERIEMENRTDYESVFRAVDSALFDIKVLDFLKSGFTFYSWLKDKLP